MSQIIGHGSTITLGTGGGAGTSLAGVTSIDFGSNKVDAHDNTDMGTPGKTRTFMDGLENPGDISVKFNVKPGDATQEAFFAAKDAGGNHPFTVVYPSAVETRAFNGIITSIDESIPDDKLPTRVMKIQVSGAITRS